MAPGEKKAADEQQTILWLDETSVYLLPMAIHTFAPRGQTPLLRAKLSHDHLSVISALSQDGQVWFALQPRSYDAAAVIAFLQTLLDTLPGRLLVIWDGATIHRSTAVKAFLGAGAAHRLHLERLPAYAPDLNPDEGVWNLLKRAELANQCFPDLVTLQTAVEAAMQRLHATPHRLLGCIRECAYLA